jgi:hypothetical protein
LCICFFGKCLMAKSNIVIKIKLKKWAKPLAYICVIFHIYIPVWFFIIEYGDNKNDQL